jgi:hypothetical protein
MAVHFNHWPMHFRYGADSPWGGGGICRAIHFHEDSFYKKKVAIGKSEVIVKDSNILVPKQRVSKSGAA